MKKYIIVLLIIAALAIISVFLSKDDKVSTETAIETSEIIAVVNDIPEALSYLPSYPETPKEIITTEYAGGWKIAMTVPNAYSIALTAWISALKEKGMNVNEVLEFTNQANGLITWASVTMGDKFFRTSIATINDKETRITIYAKK